MRHFCEDVTASKTAILLGINRNTVHRYFNLFRQKITTPSLQENTFSLGEFELDESYFGAKRIRGKRGRGAPGKTPIFGLRKPDGSVCVELVANF